MDFLCTCANNCPGHSYGIPGNEAAGELVVGTRQESSSIRRHGRGPALITQLYSTRAPVRNGIWVELPTNSNPTFALREEAMGMPPRLLQWEIYGIHTFPHYPMLKNSGAKFPLHTLSITAIKAPTTTSSILLPLTGLNVPHACHMHILCYGQRQ